MTNREAGINVVREMMGDQAVDQVFADIWTRPGLEQALPQPGFDVRHDCHATATGCCCRGYQGAWSGRRRKLHWPPRPALTLELVS
jgi:hypothetical protein